MRVFFASIILLMFYYPASAQQEKSQLPELKKFLERLEKTVTSDKTSTGDETDILQLPPDFEPNKETKLLIQQSAQEYFRYRVRAFDHRINVLWWQHTSSQMIFFVVIIVVFVGLYFSWIQFYESKENKIKVTTTIEATKSGMKISSPVLGVIILSLSLIFFYLYLVHVYPIRNIL